MSKHYNPLASVPTLVDVGDPCPDCEETLQAPTEQPEDCSCHIDAPCVACLTMECSECGWVAEV